jgi:2-dehydropantoate 2-reductase
VKILIYGAGVIGSIFAAKLSLSGNDVTVLARGNRLEEIRREGIVLQSPGSRKREVARTKVVDRLSPEERFDYIFVAMQRTQVNSVLESLARNCSENIVFVVNTAAGYEEWKRAVGAERVIIGFPSAGGERLSGGVRYFVGRGLMRVFQTTTFGEASGEKSQRVAKLIGMFRRAGIPCVVCADMDAWQKTHVAMVTNIANALYGHGCDNKRLANSRKDVRNMVLGVKEGFAVLEKLGTKVTPRKLAFWRLPTVILTVAFEAIMSTQLAELTMAKHCIAARAEMVALQEEFDRLIQKSGQKTPHIDLLRENLTKAQ